MGAALRERESPGAATRIGARGDGRGRRDSGAVDRGRLGPRPDPGGRGRNRGARPTGRGDCRADRWVRLLSQQVQSGDPGQRQPGSSFKPFIYSAALDKGYTPASFINDAPVVFDDPGLEDKWRPENYSGKFFGPTRLRVALYKSRNLVSIRLLRAMGIEHTLAHLKRFGLDPDRLPPNLSLALGTGTITPLELASGYAVLANGGYLVEPYFLDRVLDPGGKPVYIAQPRRVCRDCKDEANETKDAAAAIAVAGADGAVATVGAVAAVEEVAAAPKKAAAGGNESGENGLAPPLGVAARTVSAQNAWIMNSMMRDVIRRGTGRKARSLGRKDLAGKTGTTNDQRDAWFSGFNPGLVTTTWVGFDQLHPLGPTRDRRSGGASNVDRVHAPSPGRQGGAPA